MKNPFTSQEKEIILNRCKNPHYQERKTINQEKFQKFVKNIQAERFSIKDFSEIIRILDFMIVCPYEKPGDYIEELDKIHAKSERKLNKLTGGNKP